MDLVYLLVIPKFNIWEPMKDVLKEKKMGHCALFGEALKTLKLVVLLGLYHRQPQ
jgi:hypothetical protein